MTEIQFSLIEQVFITLVLTVLITAVVVAPLEPIQKLLPFTTLFLLSISFLYVLRLFSNLERQKEEAIPVG